MTHVASAHVGRFEIRTICEGFAALSLAEEFPGETVDWAAERRTYPWAYHGLDAWAWHVHAFVVETPDATVVVDTGAGPFGPYRPWEHWNADAWAKEDLGAVTHVALTHLHADHAGGIEAAELQPRFQNAAYHLHPADLRYFEGAHDDAYVGDPASGAAGVARCAPHRGNEPRHRARRPVDLCAWSYARASGRAAARPR